MRVFLAAFGLALVACAADSPAVEREPHENEVFFAGLRQLTFGGQNAEAYFSPDGRRLIFQHTGEEGTCDQQFTMNIDGTDLQQVSLGGRTTCGYFYQGGDRIVYASTVHVDSACPAPPDYSRGYVWPVPPFDLITANADGSDQQVLVPSPAYDAEATVSPDGRTIVFTSSRDGDLDIYTVNVDGTNLRRLTHTPGYDGGAFFSPDGSMIVYRAQHPATPEELAEYQELLAQQLVRPSQMDIWVMNADGSNQRQVTNLGGASFAPYFHPDGQRILFSSNHQDPRSRNFDLFLINLDGTNLVQVTFDGDFDGFPMFSSDGTKLVFASNRHGSVAGETNLFIADWREPTP